jgi:hypothetical protein
MESAGIMGPKLSGKSTLAMAISREYWRKHKMRSLVLDPNLDDWGKQAWVTNDEEKFWRSVWSTTYCLVIVDEAGETINRDKELISVFTRLRHLHHKLIVVGHSGVNLLPIMRQQLDTLYLFRQSRKSAAMWAEDMTQAGFIEAEGLDQFVFLYGEKFKAPIRQRLSLPRQSASSPTLAPVLA